MFEDNEMVPLNKKLIGLTYGSFDGLHRGHINLFEECRKSCDILIASVASDDFHKSKGKTRMMSCEDIVNKIVKLRYADGVLMHNSYKGKGSTVDRLCEMYNISLKDMTLFIGPDQEQGDYETVKCKIVTIPRTEGISSTQLRQLAGV